MKTEIIFPTIERWHCVDLVLENMRLAEKPEDIQVLCVLAGSDDYYNYVKNRLEKIFKKVRIIRNPDGFIEHSKLRKEIYENQYISNVKINDQKLLNIFKTYQLAMDNIEDADLYWFIEDDTLFPLDVFKKYTDAMDIFNCDIVSGQSYYWHTLDKQKRNFWKTVERPLFGQGDTSGEKIVVLEDLGMQEEGAVKLGATGLGNVLAKKETVKSWHPMEMHKIQNGADIAFFYNAELKGFPAYGIWSIYLPHITVYSNKDIEIRGRIDESIIPLVNKFYGERR
jgi:hypothetical protein